jgi:hypothetical protein
MKTNKPKSKRYTAVAAQVATHKRLYPERYCPVARCLWRTGGGYCPRHEPECGMACERIGALDGSGKIVWKHCRLAPRHRPPCDATPKDSYARDVGRRQLDGLRPGDLMVLGASTKACKCLCHIPGVVMLHALPCC